MATPLCPEAFAAGVDVLDGVGQVPEVAASAIVLGVPVVGELDLGLLVPGCGQEHQCEAALRHVLAAQHAQAQAIAVEAKGCNQVCHADHGVEVFHRVAAGLKPVGSCS